MRTILGEREKVTVYFASEFTGRIIRREGRLVRIEDYTDPGRAHRGADVLLVAKGDRREQRISSSFWLIVDGWGHPDPASTGDDYRAHDPSRVDEFLAGAGAGLDARFSLASKTLSIFSILPRSR